MNKKTAILIIIIITCVTICAGFLSSKLTFDYDFEHFFPQNNPDLDYFLKFRKTYENDNDYVLIAIGDKKGIFNQNFLTKATDF